jgi:hypothetical protein
MIPEELADLPPEDFVAARDALAKALKADGKVAEAAEVKKLKRPTVQAWITDQVRRHHDDVVDALRDASAAVATAQEEAISSRDRDALKQATAARKDALRDVGRAVEQVLARNGRPAAHRDEVLAAIESAVTDEVTGGGFGLRDDVNLPKRTAPKRDVEAERKATEARAEIEAAEQRVERAKTELSKAEESLAAVVKRHAGVQRDA